MKQQEPFKNNILSEKNKITMMMQMVLVLYENKILTWNKKSDASANYDEER